MRPRLLSACVAVAVAAGFLAGSPRAAAEFVTLRFDRTAGNPTVSTSLQANAPVGPFFWTENNLPPNTNFPPPTSTFCIELTQGQILPSPGTSVVFGVSSVAAAPTINSTDKANSITELYGRFYNTAWNNAAFTSSGSGDTSIAFQLALWELVYDGSNPSNTDSLSDGTFSLGNIGTAFNTAQAWLNALNGDASSFGTRFPGQELVALRAPAPGAKQQDQVQDQITMRPGTPVPAPAGVILAGIGFVGLVGRSRWLRRKPAVV